MSILGIFFLLNYLSMPPVVYFDNIVIEVVRNGKTVRILDTEMDKAIRSLDERIGTKKK